MKSDSKAGEVGSQSLEELIPVGRFSESDSRLIASAANQVKNFIGTIEIYGIARGTACLMENGKIICRAKYLIKILSAGNNVELSNHNTTYLSNCQIFDNIKHEDDIILEEHNLHLNHYMLMSEDYYNIGIFDPEGKNPNPLNGESYSDEYRNLAKFWSNLPTYEKSKNIVQSIEKNDVILAILIILFMFNMFI